MCIRDRTGTVHSRRDRRHSPCPGKERLERCSLSAKGHSEPQIHSRDNHAARTAHRPACPNAPYGRCGADERGLVMVSVYSLWKADHHTGPVSYTHLDVYKRQFQYRAEPAPYRPVNRHCGGGHYPACRLHERQKREEIPHISYHTFAFHMVDFLALPFIPSVGLQTF